MKNIRFILAILTTALLSASAEAKNIEVRFAALSVPPNLGEILMTTSEIRSDSFVLPLNHLSAAQTAPARVFRLEPKDKPAVLASVTLPEAGDDFIILLIPGMEKNFEAVVIPAKDDSFRPGDYYVHNVTKNEVSVLGLVGTTKFIVPPRKGKIVRPAGAREEGFYDVTLGVREGDSSRVISSSRWPVGKRMRTYIFFFDNPRSDGIAFRAVDEFVPLEKKQSP